MLKDNFPVRAISDYVTSLMLFGALFALAVSESPATLPAGTLDSLFFFALGTLFISAYLFENSLVIFGMVVWVCRKLSFPEGKYMALVFGCLFFAASGFYFRAALA